MSALPEEIEAGDPKVGGQGGRRSSPQSLMWARLAPYRAEAIRLGFTFLKRDCSPADENRRRCVDTFVHECGIWLDLVGNTDLALPFGPVVAEFRAWAIDRTELIEVATVAATPLRRPRLSGKFFFGILEWLFEDKVPTHPLRSAADLAIELSRHRSVLSERDLTPLVARDDALAERARWQSRLSQNLWLIAPP